MYYLRFDVWLLPLIISMLMGYYAYKSLGIAIKKSGTQIYERSTEISKRVYRAFEFFFTVTTAIVGGIGYVKFQAVQNDEIAYLAEPAMTGLAALQYLSCCFLIIAVTAHLGSKYERWIRVCWKEWWRWIEPWIMILAYVVSTAIWVVARLWSIDGNIQPSVCFPVFIIQGVHSIELMQIITILALFISLFGIIMAIWRYEISKYNEIARRELNELVKLFHSEFIGKENKLILRCILTIMATFNSTHAWIEIKQIFNRFLGLSHDLEFKPKTPRYFEELTEIAEAINKDNGIMSIKRFFPVVKSLFQDQNYREWLDLAIELLTIPTTRDFYQIDKCFKFFRRYIKYGLYQSGEEWNFGIDAADRRFFSFLRRHQMCQLDSHMEKIFSSRAFVQRYDIDERMKSMLSAYLEMKFLEEEKYLKNKGCSTAQATEIMQNLKDRWIR